MSDGPAPAPDLPPLPRPARSAILSLWLGLSRLAGPLGVPVLKKRLARGKEDAERWREKLGEATLPRPEGRLIWLHAVSVGESLSILPLVGLLVAGGARVLVTTTTVTSARLMAGRLPQGAMHQFLPLDTPRAVGRFLDHWRPDAGVIVESELWPRLIHDAHARGVPLILANARMSGTSARRWRRLPGPIRAILSRFTAITVPDAGIAGLLSDLGADPARITVTGSLKRGAKRLPVEDGARADLAAAFADRPRWVAASTHTGEEEIILAAHRAVLATRPDALLVLAPRHPERGGEVAGLVAKAGLTMAQRTLGEVVAPATQVYLADTLGELGLWFDLCPTAFIGGSLVPVGGHNAYEPVAHDAAVLTGPRVENFASLYARLSAAGGVRVVADGDALATAVANLFDPDRRAPLTAAASAAIAEEGDGDGDATAVTAALVLAALRDAETGA